MRLHWAVAVALAIAPTMVPARAGGQRSGPTTAIPPLEQNGTTPLLRTPGGAAGTSLVLPGLGQYVLGRPRWMAYAAVELFGWLSYLERRGDGLELQDRYRDLAWDVARAESTLPRREREFEYYELMGRYTASGRYDADPAAGLQPETEAATYNGMIWGLARALYFPGGQPDPVPDTPAYQQALRYYADRAITPPFLWSWEGHAAEQETFRDLIRRSDDALRAATLRLGLVVVNHLASGIDAYITARLRQASGTRDASATEGSGPRLRTDLDVSPVGLRWTARLEIPWD